MPEPMLTSWILEADEQCEHCGQTYAIELEVRCVACDAPVCPFCVVLVRESARCPDASCCDEDE